MNSITLNELKSFEIDINLTNLVLSLITSIICAFIVKLIYLKYAKSISDEFYEFVLPRQYFGYLLSKKKDLV